MADTTVTPEPPAWSRAPGLDDLEHRLQKLEDVVSAICDTQAIEDRVLQRVTDRLPAPTPPGSGRSQHHDEVPPHPSEAELHMLKPPTASFAQLPFLPPQGSAWLTELSLLGEVWWELRATFRMIRDPLFRMSWLCRVVPLLCLLYVAVWSWVSAYFFGSIPVISVLDDLLVIYVGLKIVGRELRRFRAHEAYYRRR